MKIGSKRIERIFMALFAEWSNVYELNQDPELNGVRALTGGLVAIEQAAQTFAIELFGSDTDAIDEFMERVRG